MRRPSRRLSRRPRSISQTFRSTRRLCSPRAAIRLRNGCRMRSRPSSRRHSRPIWPRAIPTARRCAYASIPSICARGACRPRLDEGRGDAERLGSAPDALAGHVDFAKANVRKCSMARTLTAGRGRAPTAAAICREAVRAFFVRQYDTAESAGSRGGAFDTSYEHVIGARVLICDINTAILCRFKALYKGRPPNAIEPSFRVR